MLYAFLVHGRPRPPQLTPEEVDEAFGLAVESLENFGTQPKPAQPIFWVRVREDA